MGHGDFVVRWDGKSNCRSLVAALLGMTEVCGEEGYPTLAAGTKTPRGLGTHFLCSVENADTLQSPGVLSSRRRCRL
jgi:hypothetical protein